MYVSALVKLLACWLFGAKPLPEPMQGYCQLDSWEQISVKFETEFYHFHSRKCLWNHCLLKWPPFCPGGDEWMCKVSSVQPPCVLCAHGLSIVHSQDIAGINWGYVMPIQGQVCVLNGGDSCVHVLAVVYILSWSGIFTMNLNCLKCCSIM